jgi:hypothetical protein
LELVANRMAATKTTMMTGTTKNGEVISMAQTPGVRVSKAWGTGARIAVISEMWVEVD